MGTAQHGLRSCDKRRLCRPVVQRCRRAALLIGVGALTALRAEAYDWKASAAFSYTTGDYGDEEDTEIFYVPLTLKRYFDSGDAALTVPYLRVESGGEGVIVDGRPQGTGGGDTESADGLGDLVLKGRYYALQQRGAWPYVDLTAKVKLPTADEDKGLGTGEPDYGLGVELMRRIGKEFYGFFDVGYTFIGDPSGVDYNNQWAWDVGAGWQLAPAFLASVFYEEREAIVDGSPTARSVFFAGDLRVTPQVNLNGLVEFGLSDGAPDYGVTAGTGYRF